MPEFQAGHVKGALLEALTDALGQLSSVPRPDIDMFRGEFIGLNGGVGFYASDIKGLH